jgi:hypothetical protein
VTALGKVVRTTAFKLSAIYIAVFSIFSVFFVLYISYTADVLLNQQLQETIATEISASPTVPHRRPAGGVDVIEQRSHQPGASLYLVTDVNGRILAGNVAEVPATCFERPASSRSRPYERYTGTAARGHGAGAPAARRLPLLVGRDIGEREQFREIIGRR